VRDLIRSLWRAPRIHGELLKLGIDVAPVNGLEINGAEARSAVSVLEDLPSQTRGWDRGVADHVGGAALTFGSSEHYAFFPVAAPCFWMKTLICSRSEVVADAGLNPRHAFRKSKS